MSKRDGKSAYGGMGEVERLRQIHAPTADEAYRAVWGVGPDEPQPEDVHMEEWADPAPWTYDDLVGREEGSSED
jgi:hypothetical protein